jgi:hypothetical protein
VDLGKVPACLSLPLSRPILDRKIPEKTRGRARILVPVAARQSLASEIFSLYRRTISPFSKLTVPEWIEHRIKENTFYSLRAAIQIDPANARLGCTFWFGAR